MVQDRKAVVISIAPTLDTNAYATGDGMGPAIEIPNCVDNPGDTATLTSIMTLDKIKQKPAMDLLFFSDKPAIASADNAALDITDAEMNSKFLGAVSLAAADFKDLSASSYQSVKLLGLKLKGTKSADNPNGTSCWAVLQSRGSPTYGVSDLTFKLGIDQD